tara:strand:- start:522 stop:1166 length:645 start_codon:yes stop_codon:yes gene_type:complete
MKTFKIRCSAIGLIMTNAKSKSDLISKTTASYCKEWMKEQIYSRKKEISSKYFDKGNIMEQNSLDYIASELGYDSLPKNEKSFENDYLTGTPDAIFSDHIIDVKNSWDCFTFPLFFDNVPNKNYYWQAQGYMALTGLDYYRLIYTLMDTPEELIKKEYFGSNLDYDTFAKHYKYSDIDSKYRIKVFELERNDLDIDRIYTRVEECREYINNINL